MLRQRGNPAIAWVTKASGFEGRIRGARRPTAERLAEHGLVSRNGTPFQPGIVARMLEA